MAQKSGTQAAKVARIVWSIISYTRWPNSRHPLRVCLSRKDSFAEIIRQSAYYTDIGREIHLRDIPVVNPAGQCDVIYFSSGSQTGFRVQPVLKELEGKPVLTIGDGIEFCALGGMFCLIPNELGSRFGANRSAVLRSPLRINSKMLRMTTNNRHGKEK